MIDPSGTAARPAPHSHRPCCRPGTVEPCTPTCWPPHSRAAPSAARAPRSSARGHVVADPGGRRAVWCCPPGRPAGPDRHGVDRRAARRHGRRRRGLRRRRTSVALPHLPLGGHRPTPSTPWHGWLVREWRIAPISRVQTVDTQRGPAAAVARAGRRHRDDRRPPAGPCASAASPPTTPPSSPASSPRPPTPPRGTRREPRFFFFFFFFFFFKKKLVPRERRPQTRALARGGGPIIKDIPGSSAPAPYASSRLRAAHRPFRGPQRKSGAPSAAPRSWCSPACCAGGPPATGSRTSASSCTPAGCAGNGARYPETGPHRRPHGVLRSTGCSASASCRSDRRPAGPRPWTAPPRMDLDAVSKAEAERLRRELLDRTSVAASPVEQ